MGVVRSSDSPGRAGPGGALAATAQQRLRQRHQGGGKADQPVRHRVPDDPEIVASNLCFVAPVDDQAAGELQQADQRQDHAMPFRQQADDVQLRRQLDELSQCPQQHDEQHGVGPHHAQHILQQHPPHAPFLPVQQRPRMPQHHFHAALRPAQPLPPPALQ
ncbi:hypothetical protein G6F59_015975 [Rhizopus arrhizus]|nr:hypothetical protein G6F59_015975 [Rhizopus arrhizus]